MKLQSRRMMAVAGVAMFTLLTACSASTGEDGSGSESSGSSDFKLPADAQTLLDEAVKAPEWTPPAKSPAPAKDKFVISIPCAQAAVGCARPSDAFLAGAKAMGWRTQRIDPAGDPKKMQSAIKSALQLGADGVFLASGSVEAIGADLLKEARQKGLVMFILGGPDQPLGPDGWSGIMNNDYALSAPALAAYVAKNSGGKAKALVVDNSEFPQVAKGARTFSSSLKKFCKTCEVAEKLDFSIVDLTTTFPTRVKATLQANPDINYIYAPYDFAATQISTALEQAGLAGKVKIVGADGNPQNLKAINDGMQLASYARPAELMGWAMVDQMNRLFQGEETINDDRGFQTEDYPTQLLDKSNLPADVTGLWAAGIDYQSAYKKLWGVS